MSMEAYLNKLNDLRREIEAGGGDAAIDKVKQAGNLTARERINVLLDESSFVEIGAFVKPRSTDYNMTTSNAPADGVVTGYGTVNGRLVYVYSQDATVMGGSLGEMHAKKIASLYDMAIKIGAPIVGMLDSVGMRLQEGVDGFEGYGQIFVKQSLASGVIPQITAILGTCGGSAAMLPSLSDFVLMKKENTTLYLNSPNTLDSIKETTEPIGDSSFHDDNAGIVDVVCDDDLGLISDLRDLLNLLPSNNQEETPSQDMADDLNRDLTDLEEITNGYVDGREIIGQLVDTGTYFEVKRAYGEDVATVIGQLAGMTVAFVGTASQLNDGRLSLKAAQKVEAFVKKMDAFSIPVITLVDVIGNEATVDNELNGQAKALAFMMATYAGSTVPKLTVLMNNAIGSAYVALNSKHVGADIVYAWPMAKIGTMDASSAVKIMYAEEIDASKVGNDVIAAKTKAYKENEQSVYKAAAHGYVDDIIEPNATRRRLIASVDMLFTKYVQSPDRKHRSV